MKIAKTVKERNYYYGTVSHAGKSTLRKTYSFTSRGIFFCKISKSTNTSLSHFYDKLLKLKDYMHTYTAKKLAEKRTTFLKSFLDEFYDEIK